MYCQKNQPIWQCSASRCLAVVVIEQAAELLLAPNPSLSRQHLWRQQLVLHSLVISLLVIMNFVGPQGCLQMVLTQENQAVCALGLYRAYKPFCNCIALRNPGRAQHDLDADRFENLPES